MNLHELTIHQAVDLLKSGEVSSAEITRAVLDRIDAVEHKIDAYITICRDTAMQRAGECDKLLKAGKAPPLLGIPVALKDVLCTRGIRTTCGSQILSNFVPPYNAAVMERLSDAGAVLIGKTNMDEFAMGSTTENSGIKITKNPWNPDCIPGGSSGGSAAAVAADMCLAALGSDTGGSIRQPASHCGVVGLKPTYGRVSRLGLVAFASSLDQIGPITKDVADAAVLLNVISGHDPGDGTSIPRPVPDYTEKLSRELKGLRVGLPREYFELAGLSGEVKSAVDGAVKTLTELGAQTVPVTLPMTRHAVAAYYVIAPAEASSNLARYDGVNYGFRDKDADRLMDMYLQSRRKGFGPEVIRRVMIGTYALSAGYYDAYYGKASQVRTLIIEDFTTAFKACDVIAGPVAPTPAGKIGEGMDDPLTLYLSDVYTLSANLAGIPGLSVPCGYSRTGLPIGLQLLGPHFSEETLLRTAYQYEQATAKMLKRPVLSSR